MAASTTEGYKMGIEILVREADQPLKLTEATLEKLIREKRCIIFHVMGAGGSMIPVRARSDKPMRVGDNEELQIQGWLPDCSSGPGIELDRCIITWNPSSKEIITVKGKRFVKMGTLQFNLNQIPAFVKPALPPMPQPRVRRR